MKRIQDTPEYIIVKRITKKESIRNTRRVILYAGLFVASCWAWMYALVFLMF